MLLCLGMLITADPVEIVIQQLAGHSSGETSTGFNAGLLTSTGKLSELHQDIKSGP